MSEREVTLHCICGELSPCDDCRCEQCRGADEIERLRAEIAETDGVVRVLRRRNAELADKIERLRAAGDKLAAAAERTYEGYAGDLPHAFAAWREVTR